MTDHKLDVPTLPPADPRRWRALGALSLVRFVIVIDNTVVNVALPSIRHALHLSATGLVWVVNGYMLAGGGLLVLGGRMADLLGRRRMFLVGTAVFGLASMMSGLAPNSGVLIASRFAQGIGEALAAPAALSLLVLLFPQGTERSRALSIWGAIAGIGSILGVLLSGVLTSVVGWRWVFLVNLPFAAAALVLVPRLIPQSPPTAPGRRVDVVGAVLVTGGLVSLVDGLLAASHHALGDAAVVVPLALGAVALGAFVAVEARIAEPLVPLRVLADKTRSSANLATLFLFACFSATFLLLTLLMQDVLHYSALQTGLAYLPLCFAFIGGFALSGFTGSRLGTKGTLLVGFTVASIGMLLLSRASATGSYAVTLLPGMCVFAVGLGMSIPALQVAALHGATEHDAGLSSGVQSTAQAVAGALGNAVLFTVALRYTSSRLAGGAGHAVAEAAGYRVGFVVGAGVLVGGALLVLFAIRCPPSPATTLQPTAA